MLNWYMHRYLNSKLYSQNLLLNLEELLLLSIKLRSLEIGSMIISKESEHYNRLFFLVFPSVHTQIIYMIRERVYKSL